MEWQPIQTAPKDGTVLLLGAAGHPSVCAFWYLATYRLDGVDEEYGEVVCHVSGETDRADEWPGYEPTHWTHLPAVRPMCDPA